ncbi:MAG: TIGR03915 family putative DNA repair protein [Chitinophagaceae bacterium]
MQTIIYDGSFDSLLCAVFDVYEYKFTEVHICTTEHFKGNIFEKVHHANKNDAHANRVLRGLEKKLSLEAVQQLYRAFLSETEGMENVLLQYMQYVFGNTGSVEKDYSHPAIITIVQTAKKVWREKHRMEAFVRFQKTGDDLYYAIIEPDYNVLPLIAHHFQSRYADQRWLIYDTKRKMGLYYNLQTVEEVTLQFSEEVQHGKEIAAVYDAEESVYQQLWQQYFKSVNIAARKNTKLHLQHMPRRYWRNLTEKAVPQQLLK